MIQAWPAAPACGCVALKSCLDLPLSGHEHKIPALPEEAAMIFQALARLANAVSPPKDAERPGPDAHRRQPSAARGAKRAPQDEAEGPHPVLNTQGETTGKLIDTQA